MQPSDQMALEAAAERASLRAEISQLRRERDQAIREREQLLELVGPVFAGGSDWMAAAKKAEAERDEARAALRDLTHPWGCWCLAGGERAVDHSDACRQARAVLGEG